MTRKEQLFADLEKDGISNNDNQITKAKNGNGDIMNNIGVEYENKQQYDKAMAWYRLAADKNSSNAQTCIGYLYAKGEGVPFDYSLALEWFLKAAIQNNKTAWENIGILFENGCGVPADKYKALEWYTKSGEDSDGAKKLTDQGIRLTQQDKDKSIEQLIMETEKLAWPEGRSIKEKQLRKEIDRLKQSIYKKEEESIAKNNEINLLKEEVRSLRVASERQQQNLDVKQEFIEQYKTNVQTINNELQALKQANHTLTVKLEAKESVVSALKNENKVLRVLSGNSSQGTAKRLEELEKSNQTFEKLLEQERQLKDSQIEVIKEKMEISLEKEKQKRNEVEKKYRAIKRELKNMKISPQTRISPKQIAIKIEKDEDNNTSSSDNETDYDTEYDSAGSDNNDINYDTPNEDGGDDDDSRNDLNYDSDELSKNRKKISSVQSASGSRR